MGPVYFYRLIAHNNQLLSKYLAVLRKRVNIITNGIVFTDRVLLIASTERGFALAKYHGPP